jgi:predicted outer membrane protein
MKGNRLMGMILTAAATTAFVACASTPQYDTASAAGNLSLLDAPPVTLSADELTMLSRMTDANILGHVAMADSVEVVMAEFAEKRTMSDDILAYARRMDTDHSTHLLKTRDLAGTTNVGIHTIVGEMKASHMGEMVDSIGPQKSEVNFSRNYVLSQVQMHRHMLAELNELAAVAKNAAVRDHITATIPVVQGHLNDAIALARKYDYASKKSLMKN